MSHQANHKQLTLILTGIMALGGLTALLAYLDARRDKEVKSELLRIEKQIKELQLEKLAKNG
jgi:hypothetical protein